MTPWPIKLKEVHTLSIAIVPIEIDTAGLWQWQTLQKKTLVNKCKHVGKRHIFIRACADMCEIVNTTSRMPAHAPTQNVRANMPNCKVKTMIAQWVKHIFTEKFKNCEFYYVFAFDITKIFELFVNSWKIKKFIN